MPTYEYIDPDGQVYETFCDRDRKAEVDELMRTEHEAKPYYGSVQFGTVMQSHFNNTTNSEISDPRQFERELKVKSLQAEERTGIPHNFVPVDPHDKAAIGVTDEGMKETHDRAVKLGMKPPTARTIH